METVATDDVLSFFQVRSFFVSPHAQSTILQLLPFFRHKMAATFLTCIMTPFYLSSPSSWTTKQPSPLLLQFTSAALSALLSLVGSEHYTASSRPLSRAGSNMQFAPWASSLLE